ncbi:uncharacterized protein F4822DRAFT_434215 [Hypoxylon trugodes]|uniref:uncharacterized protein n=1 Tax=Hypoxylon trugodes TaxID=326681 RepID=UPI0021987C3F|nr:uncharacterized protein F4822DRAFT_434215 [Hypoxylon trugodes]KAI1384277.1 hypothetical protein F4822DRAFT_434215 [Hypoxylon trugodes]
MAKFKYIVLFLVLCMIEASVPRQRDLLSHGKLNLQHRGWNTSSSETIVTSSTSWISGIPSSKSSSKSSSPSSSATSTPSTSSTSSGSSSTLSSSASSSSSLNTLSSTTSSTSSTSSSSTASSLSTTLSSSTTSSSTTIPTSSGTTSQTTTSQSSSEQFSLTPVTSFPVYSAPTATITGAAETSSAVAIAPVFVAVWKNRGNLLDDKTKQQYIKDVSSTKNQVESLYNNLPDKSDPPEECSKTSGSGSLISGIKDLLTTPAKLISCASKVVGNLVDAVNVVDPVIATVETLTDTLQDIGNELEKGQNDDPTSTKKPTSSDKSTDSKTSSTSSECSTTSAASCIKTITLSTSWYTDSTTKTSDVKTITTTVCATITGCSVKGTTATTTTSTATTSSGTGWVCDFSCAAGGCAASKRAADPTSTPEPIANSQNLGKRNLKPTGKISNIDQYIISTLSSSGAEGLAWNKGIAVSKYYQFLNKAFVKYVAGVTGCTSIIVISEKGAWISHFMETGFMPDDGRKTDRDQLDAAVKDGNSNYERPADLAVENGDLNKDSQSVQIYVSGPCTYTTDASGNKVCDEKDGAPNWEYTRIDTLLTTLFGAGTPFEGVPITKRGYIKPTDRDEVDSLADTSARGKVVVQYDSNQLTDQFLPFNPKHAAYRVWLESSPYQKDWVASSCQGGNAPNQKRDGSCPVSGSGGVSSSSATATSKTATPSQQPTDSTTSIASTSTAAQTSQITSTEPSRASSSTILTVTPSPTSISSVPTTISIVISPSPSPQTSDTSVFESVVIFSSTTATEIS